MTIIPIDFFKVKWKTLMKIKTPLKYFLGCLLAANCAVGWADDSEVPAKQYFINTTVGFYLGGSVGYGTVFARSTDYTGVTSVGSQGGFAWDAILGYQFNPYLALQANYTSFGYAALDTTQGVGKVSLAGYGFDAKGMYPVNPKLDLFAQAGIMSMTTTLKNAGLSGGNTAWVPDVGLGVAYHLLTSLDATLKDIYAFRNGSNAIPAANAVLAGLNYKITF